MAEFLQPPQSKHHQEKHFIHNEVVRDLVIGMSDGLTVPFALAAGLSSAVHSNHIILIAGLAEMAAGAIAMGLGGYLAAKSDNEHFLSELAREHREIADIPEIERKEVAELLGEYGISEAASLPLIDELSQNPNQWARFMMRFELGLEQPSPKRALASALTIGGAYVLGGFIPLSPYFWAPDPHLALLISVGVTLIALGVFGGLKGYCMGLNPWKNASQTMLIGGCAAGIAYAIAKLIQ